MIEAVFGAAEAFFRPAYTGLMPQTVPEELLQEANAATALVNTVAEFAGPALATALVLGIGAGWAFALDAATFLVSAAFVIRVRPRRRGEVRPPSSVLDRPARGLDRVPRPHVGVGDGRDLQLPADLRARAVLRARRDRGRGRLRLARLLRRAGDARSGAGTIAGAVIAHALAPAAPDAGGVRDEPRLARGDRRRSPPARRAALLVALFVLAGLGLSLFDVWWQTALAQRIPPHALSRVSSYDWMGSLALLPLGYLLAGPIGEAIGPAETMLIGGAVGVAIAALGFAIPDVWRLRALSSTT